MKRLTAVLSLLLCMAFLVPSGTILLTSSAASLDTSFTLRQYGNQLMNEKGQVVRLLGVNVPELSWTVSGPATSQVEAKLDLALGEWQSNCIRLPIVPSYWNNGVFKLAGGKLVDASGNPTTDPAKAIRLMTKEEFRALVDRLIAKITAAGKYVMLGNHSFYLPNEDSFEFWTSAAAHYKDHPNVIFGLFNEPTKCTWDDWKNGGRIQFKGYNMFGVYEDVDITSKGIQKLLNTVRATGAKNIVSISGLDWGYDLTYVTTDYRLTDAENTNGLMYETHIYPERDPDYDTCFGVAAQEYPVIVGECGPQFSDEQGRPLFVTNLRDDGAKAYMKKLLEYFDKYELHVTAWALGSEPNLLSSSGQPTEYGKMIKNYIAENQVKKSATLYKGRKYNGASVSINPGYYSAATLEALGIKITEIASFTSKINAYQYGFVFFEGEDGSGKNFTVANGTTDITSYSMGFQPKALMINRYQPTNILTKDSVSISAENADNQDIYNIVDGTMKKWRSTRTGSQIINIKLKKPHMVTSVVLMHAAIADGEMDAYNTKSYSVSISENGSLFKRVADVTNNSQRQTEHRFEPVIATDIRITIREGSMIEPEAACLAEVYAIGTAFTGSIPPLPSRIGLNVKTSGAASTDSSVPGESDSSNEDTSSQESVSSEEDTNHSSDPGTDTESTGTTGSRRKVMRVNWPLTIGLIAGGVLAAAGLTVFLILALRAGKKKKKLPHPKS